MNQPVTEAKQDANQLLRDDAEMGSEQDISRIRDLDSEPFVMRDETIPDGEVHAHDGLVEWTSGGRSHV